MSDREAFLRAFHAERPGATSRAFGRGGTYERLAARVPPGGCVLDLACGDGALLALLARHARLAIGIDLSHEELARSRSRPVDARLAIGIDLSHEELAQCRGHVVQGRAQALPFADATFSAATCHLAFMLFDDIARVVAELARVLAPGAPFYALLGGGPSAEGSDAFHAFAAMLPRTRAFGDRRASSETGWRELFAGWRDIAFERWAVDLSGTFDEVWALLGASYQLADADAAQIRRALRARFPGERVPCTVATYLARATR